MPKRRTIPIQVSSRVLRHISRGMYRTPAGALKELVSNAHDAGAKEVTLSSGFPTFDKMAITDDGGGMTATQFKKIVSHIGLSGKTVGEEFQVPDSNARRKTIGHYGIGLLAVGQLARTMQIRSKTARSLEGFTAELDFDQFEVVAGEHADRARMKTDAWPEQEERQASDSADSQIPIGTCQITRDEYDTSHKDRHFTRIELTVIRDFVFAKLGGKLRDINPLATAAQQYSATYADVLRLLRENEAEVRLGWYPYERLLWEMGVYCPVQYPDVGAFRRRAELHRIAMLAERPQFTVKIDGIAIHRPFEQCFFDDEETPVEKTFLWKDEQYTTEDGGPACSGYLIYKRRIRPKVLQGVLVRQGGIAVGLYDTTYLNYPFNEGQKLNQLTGEIFAEGLAGAMNIDRDSFNETDDRYIALCEWFHQKLRAEVFPEIKRLQKSPRAGRRAENLTAMQETLAIVARESEGRFKSVQFDSLGDGEPLFVPRRSKLFINTDHRDASGSSAKQDKVLIAAALILRGLVTPEQFEEVDQLVRQAKNEMKAKT